VNAETALTLDLFLRRPTSAKKLNKEIIKRGAVGCRNPLAITHDRIIIDRYARRELAKELKRPIPHCIEYDLSETEALKWLLQKHRLSNSMNHYSRIMLALDLEPELTERQSK